MPTYGFMEEGSGRKFDKVMTVAQLEECKISNDGTFNVDGVLCSIDYSEVNTIQSCGGWPRWSDALGVSPNQIKEQVESDRKLGLKTEYCPETGRLKIESQNHQRKIAKAMGFRDRGDYLG